MDDKELALAEAAKYAQEIELLTRAIWNLYLGADSFDEERTVIVQRLRILLELP
jgi:hypothetical protein